MLNQSSIDAVEATRIDDHLARPLYQGYSYAQLPPLVEAVLAGGTTTLPAKAVDLSPAPRHVVLILVDGFGWSYFQRFADELPFLRRIVSDGIVSKLTAQFPSTTSAQITTLHTGLPLGESGILEWFYYEPILGEIFSPLKCKTLNADGLSAVDADQHPVYPFPTLYQALGRQGVTSHCYQLEQYARSAYSLAVTRGSNIVPFRTLPEATVHLAERLRGADGPSYHCVYFDVIDVISHRHGPDSAFIAAEIRALFGLLETEVRRAFSGTDALVLVTADHGHIQVDPSRPVFVDDRVPAVTRWLQADPSGRPLLPGGSPRDMFLYVHPKHVDEAYEALSDGLSDCATVHRTADLVDGGYFGDVTVRLQERLSSLTVLPHPHEMVWWSGQAERKLAFRGHHGGLSRDELEIPLLAWRP